MNCRSVVLGKDLANVNVDSVFLEVAFDLFWGVEVVGDLLWLEFRFLWFVSARNHSGYTVVAFSRVSRHN
jgi:hypothetical protein